MKRGDFVFEWDEAKRERTRLDRGLDFADAPLFFDGRKIVVIPSPRDGEEPMPEKKERIVRFTANDLQKMRHQGEAGSDWKRAARQGVPDGSDPDDAFDAVPPDWVMTEMPLPRTKTHASIRIDADVLEWFKAQGRGYQTRINAVLRQYYEHHREP